MENSHLCESFGSSLNSFLLVRSCPATLHTCNLYDHGKPPHYHNYTTRTNFGVHCAWSGPLGMGSSCSEYPTSYLVENWQIVIRTLLVGPEAWRWQDTCSQLNSGNFCLASLYLPWIHNGSRSAKCDAIIGINARKLCLEYVRINFRHQTEQ